MINRYRKRPVEIRAVQFRGGPGGNQAEVAAFLGSAGTVMHGFAVINTAEGQMTARPGDWIIEGVAGEFYPCKPDIFAATYDCARLSDLDLERANAEADAAVFGRGYLYDGVRLDPERLITIHGKTAGPERSLGVSSEALTNG